MDAILQIALGAVPVMLFFLVLSIFSKKNRIRNAVLAFLLFVSISIVAVPVIPSFFENRTSAAELKIDELSLVYAIAHEGSPELAKAMLEDLQINYTPEYTLCAARLASKEKNYRTAKALYMKSKQYFPDIESEYNAIIALFETEKDYDKAITENNDTQEKNALTKWHALADEISNELPAIFQNAMADTNNALYKTAARHVINADEAHKSYLREEEFDADETRRQLRRINTFMQENLAFSAIPQMRLARLKLQILSEDYKAIASNVNEYSDHNELLIVSELFLNKYVRQSDFSGEFSSENTAKYELVYNKLNDIFSNYYHEKSRDERNDARTQLQALQMVIRNPALGKLGEKLFQYADGDYSLDASKAFLQMAKIEYSLGNENKVSEYLDRSIDTVGDCEDLDYTMPMYELIGIISDKEDAERIRNAAVYVEQVLANNMTVKITDISDNRLEAADAEDSLVGDFALQMQTYVNQKRMAVKIVNVDTTQFERDNTIKAAVNISNNLYTSAEALKSALSIRDCDINITDFTVEKVNYTKANILLCLDVSGSMEENNKIEMLRDAVRLFAEDIAAIENISLVTFDSSVVVQHPFGLLGDELLTIADSLRPLGGTDMYGALAASISQFSDNPGEINSIILMSDGMDNNPKSIEDIIENIGEPSKAKGITIYSIGFGDDADHEYLNRFASATGGSYLFANEPDTNTQLNQLGAFFDGLRAQILNQYVVTFKAADTLSHNRELVISVDNELNSDRVRYRLGGGTDSITASNSNDNSPIFLDGKAVYGFEPRQLFKNGQTLSATLKGEGFSNTDNIRVAVRGTQLNLSVNLSSQFLDANSVSVIIPAGIATDVYDVIVTINGKTTIIYKGLFVSQQGAQNWQDIISNIEDNPLAALEPFANADEAALAWANYFYSANLYVRHEYGAVIYRTAPGEFRLTGTVAGGPHSVNPGIDNVPFGTVRVAGHHTHPNGNRFSDGDKGWANYYKIGLYVAAPTEYQKYDTLQLRLYNASPESDTRVSANVTMRHLDASRLELEQAFRHSWESHFNSRGRCPNGFNCQRMSWPYSPWPPN